MGRTGLGLSILLMTITIAGLTFVSHSINEGIIIFTAGWIVSAYGLFKDISWGIPLTIIVLSTSIAILTFYTAGLGGIIISSLLFINTLAQVTCISTAD